MNVLPLDIDIYNYHLSLITIDYDTTITEEEVDAFINDIQNNVYVKEAVDKLLTSEAVIRNESTHPNKLIKDLKDSILDNNNYFNTGLCISNPDLNLIIMVIKADINNKDTCELYNHEKRHAIDEIARSSNFLYEGEACAYLDGFISSYHYDFLNKYLYHE